MSCRLARFLSPVAFSALVACGHFPLGLDAGHDAGVQVESDAGVDAGLRRSEPFATKVVSFNPGAGAGFGQSKFPQVVLGGPEGGGEGFGSLDVLSLGNGGSLVLGFDPSRLFDVFGS